MKNIRFFLSENFQFFLEVKFSIYLNRRVFVMIFPVCVYLLERIQILMSIKLNTYNIRGRQLCQNFLSSLRKYAYSNILKSLPPKNENFQMKTSDIFHISAQNIDCGYSLEPPRRGSSNEYPQSRFNAVIRKNNVYPCNEAVLTSTHNLCFRTEIRKIMYTPVNPSFTI